MPTSATSPEEIARLMVGRDVLLTVEKEETADLESQPVLYEVRNLATEVAPGVKFPAASALPSGPVRFWASRSGGQWPKRVS